MTKGNTSKTGLWLLLVLALFALSWPARAESVAQQFASVRNLRLSYAIYLGGLHILDSTTEYTREGPVYHVTMQAGTQGLAEMFLPWNADLDSTGRLKGDTLTPEKSVIVTHWKNKPERVEFHYANGKKVDVVYQPEKKKKPEEAVPEELKQNALDPLNGIIQMMASFANGKGCLQTVPIFDGQRRFDISLQDRGTDTLEGEEYSIFNGPAQKCQIGLAMRAGSRKDREESHFWDGGGKGGPAPIYVYLGKVKDHLPPLPVRAETQTFFGAVMIHLTAVEGGSAKVASAP